jgi:hypothetical protein
MSRRYPDGKRKQHQSFQLRLNVDVIDLLNLPPCFTRHHNDLSFLVNDLLAKHMETLQEKETQH